ncbi:hypothetical protein HPB48_019213 [Haemaphysalis longicornis]|uniref:Uncharacterized protein n=1 Tax=Haemaphysalis longicornis TaxID=44386 RepID=A0A9J6G1B7_HAELO|nr:hypothetical protein HPB48_019213 [Haemaphysalis longicornis]
MVKLAKKLQEIPSINNTLYADDIAIWTIRGSLDQKEEAFQEAANFVESLAKDRGLRSAPENSEIIRIYNSRYKSPEGLNGILEGQKNPSHNEDTWTLDTEQPKGQLHYTDAQEDHTANK